MAETVLITGASAGFGKAMTETFIHSGYRVIGAARRLEKLGKLRGTFLSFAIRYD